MPGDSYAVGIQVFLSLCDVFCALINSFVCWFCIGTLGLMLFHIVFVLYLSIQPTRHLFGQTGTMISLAKLVSFSWFLGAEDSGRAEETGVAQPQGGECGGVPRTGATHHNRVNCSEQSTVPYHRQQVWHWLSSEWQGKTDVPRTRLFITNTQKFPGNCWNHLLKQGLNSLGICNIWQTNLTTTCHNLSLLLLFITLSGHCQTTAHLNCTSGAKTMM